MNRQGAALQNWYQFLSLLQFLELFVVGDAGQSQAVNLLVLPEKGVVRAANRRSPRPNNMPMMHAHSTMAPASVAQRPGVIVQGIGVGGCQEKKQYKQRSGTAEILEHDPIPRGYLTEVIGIVERSLRISA